MTKMGRKRSMRDRVCVDCGKFEVVRRDNSGICCKSCGSRRAATSDAAVSSAAARRTRTEISCTGCSASLIRHLCEIEKTKEPFCSRECRSKFKSVDRQCMFCQGSFVTQKGRLSGKTNSSANFCSRPCYEKWLCNTERTKNRGSRWAAISKEVVKEHPFCACCGRAKGRLDVHHIVPYRLSQDSGKKNLIPLCPRCHKKIELATVELENKGVSIAVMGWYFSTLLRFRQRLMHSILKKVSKNG